MVHFFLFTMEMYKIIGLYVARNSHSAVKATSYTAPINNPVSILNCNIQPLDNEQFYQKLTLVTYSMGSLFSNASMLKTPWTWPSHLHVKTAFAAGWLAVQTKQRRL